MYWFQGGIPEAIMSSKQRNLPFVVYIEGTDESSKQMGDVWKDPKVSELFSSERCVAIKLNNESEQCKQFSQLYPVVCVPSIFIIGSTGMPLEVIGGAVSADQLIEKANTAYKAFSNEVQPSAQQSGASKPAQPEPSTSTIQSSEATSSSTIEERVERAKRLIEEKRKQKAEAEKQEKIEKETKRREEGQQLTLAKKELEERRQQEIVNQIREDREKERAAREAIREQIRRDKAEREAKRKEELREKMAAQPATSDQPEAAMKSNSNTTRLQFRLPDGSCVIETFQSDALLEAARQFIESQLESRYSSITLTTVYPRRQLTDDDMIKTLSSLGLAPSSTLIVSPSKSSAITTASSGSFIGMILAPFLALFNFLKVFLFGGSDQARGSYGGNNMHNNEGREHVRLSDSQKTSSNSDLRKRTTNNEGNVHRLRNQDDDDENNTWNGNSTQQM